MAKTMYDPWSKITTRNGYAGDEVISALQKSIRRGLEEQACMFAYELYISSPQLEEKLWRRLLTISVEDIGMGNPMAAIMVNNLYRMSREFDYSDGDRPIYFIHAIRYMCQSEKDRSSDLLKNICIKSFAMGKFPEVPDYALDKHTQRGQAMGRDSFHFLNEASQVIPQKEVNNDYKERYANILEEYDPENVVDSAFQFNGWQF
jgi:replication-associated recombination protein RarA